MDFKQFEYILEVATEKNFSKAAKKLYISQPSLSQYVNRIESQLGINIFDRTSTPLKLTYEGEIYINTAKNILTALDQMQKKFDDLNKLNIGKLNIGLTPSKANYILPKILPVFKNKYPNIELKITEASSASLEELLSKDMVDICLMNLPVKNTNFECTPILTEKILLCAPKSLSLSSKPNNKNCNFPEIDLTLLSDNEFILLKPDQRIRQITNSAFNKLGFKPKILLETRSIETSIRLASSGLGCCFVPESSAIFSGLSEVPNYYTISNPPLTWTTAIIFNQSTYRTKAALAFAEITKKVSSELQFSDTP